MQLARDIHYRKRRKLRKYVDKLNKHNVLDVNGVPDLGTSTKNLRRRSTVDFGLKADVTVLDLSGRQDIDVVKFRSLALAHGSLVSSLNLSNTSLTDEISQQIGRFSKIKTLNVSRCGSITNSAIKEIAHGCRRTLKILRAQNCINITEEGLGWVAGTIGVSGFNCRYLETLDVSECTGVRDRGLDYLGRGCQRLRFLNLNKCVGITDFGVERLAEGCTKLQVLSMEDCANLTDYALMAIGEHMHELRSLNVARVGQLTDRGVCSVAEGCPKLQRLNIAGARLTTEHSLNIIGRKCLWIQAIVLNGCERITLAGLHELVTGLKNVHTVAKTFFGIIAKKNFIELKWNLQMFYIRDVCAAKIQKQARMWRQRRKDAAKRWKQIINNSATILQTWYRFLEANWRVRAMKEHIRYREQCALLLQCIYRGHMARKRYRIILWNKVMLEQEDAVVRLQAYVRGYLIRKHAFVVKLRINHLRQRKQDKIRNKKAIIIQSTFRAWLGKLYAATLHMERQQREKDENLAAASIQRIWRGHQCRLELMFRLLAESDGLIEEASAATTIQRCFRFFEMRTSALAIRREKARKLKIRNDAAMSIQRRTRVWLAQRLLRLLRAQRIHMNKSAILIQRIYRGSLVKPWKRIKWERMRDKCEDRMQIAVEAAARRARRKLRKFKDKRSRNDDSDDPDNSDDDWGVVDGPGFQFWFSPSRNIRRFNKPDLHSFPLSLVGLRARINTHDDDDPEVDWVMAKITRYNKRTKRHCVEYVKDDDPEWMSLRDEEHRVQIEVPTVSEDGEKLFHWVLFRYFRPPRDPKDDVIDPQVLEQMGTTGQSALGNSSWELCVSDTGDAYYYNTQTGESSWELPSDFQGFQLSPEEALEQALSNVMSEESQQQQQQQQQQYLEDTGYYETYDGVNGGITKGYDTGYDVNNNNNEYMNTSGYAYGNDNGGSFYDSSVAVTSGYEGYLPSSTAAGGEGYWDPNDVNSDHLIQYNTPQ